MFVYCMCTYLIHVYICVCTCGGHMVISGAFLDHSLLYILRFLAELTV